MTVHGTGLHGGKPASVELVRDSGPMKIERDGVVRALEVFRVSSTQFSTGIACDAFEVRTVEHLFAALAGLGVRKGLRIVVSGDELPLLDGGSRAWCAEIEALELEATPSRKSIARAERIEIEGSTYEFVPGDAACVEVTLDLPRSCDANASWNGDAASFVRDIAPARTFALEHDVIDLERAGLAKHVDRESVLVVSDDAIFGSGSIQRDEPARHKLLDLIGDAYFHGGPPRGTIRATRPGHTRNHAAFARAIAAGVFACALFMTTRARADDPVRPPTLVELTHPWPEIISESTLASVTHNNGAIQGTRFVTVQRLGYEMPIAQSPWYVGAGYDFAIGQQDGAQFVSGNPEIWGRGVWNATYGLSFGGGFALVIPTGAYDPASEDPAANTAFDAIAARGWDRALFDPDNATLRPFLDVRLVTGPITVQYRQALEIATNFGAADFRFAAVGTLMFGVRFSRIFTASLDLIEYYELEPGVPAIPDDERAYFAVGAHFGIETKYFRPTIGVMTNIGSPLNAISHIGAPITVAPTSFWGVHFSLDFPFDGITIGRKKK